MKIARREMALVAVVAAAATLFACTLFVTAGEVQCASADDCHARGPAFAKAVCVASVCQAAETSSDPWACLDETSIPSDPSGRVDVEIVIYNALATTGFGGGIDGGNDLTLLTYTPLSGVTVTACAALDTSCSMPLPGQTTTDDAGIARIEVPSAFVGFYTLTRSDSVSSLFFPGRLLEGDSNVTFPTSLTSNASYSNLQAVTGIAANQDTDAGPGLVAVTQYDCNERRASGAIFTVNRSADRIVYVAPNGFPDTKATSTAANGAGLLVNVPAGEVTIASSLAIQENRPLDSATVLVRSGGITLVKLRPRTH